MAVWVWVVVGWLALGLLAALVFGLLARGGRLREEAESPREPDVAPAPRQATQPEHKAHRRTPG